MQPADQGTLKKRAVPAPSPVWVAHLYRRLGVHFLSLSPWPGRQRTSLTALNAFNHRGAGRRRSRQMPGRQWPERCSPRPCQQQSTRQARGASWARLTRPPDLHSFIRRWIDVLNFHRRSRETDGRWRHGRRTVHARTSRSTGAQEHSRTGAVRCWGSRVQSRRLASSPPCHTGGLLSPAGLFSALNT